MSKLEMVAVVLVVGMMGVGGWRLFEVEKELAPVFAAASLESRKKCDLYADKNYAVTDMFFGRLKTAVWEECIRNSNDPGYVKASRAHFERQLGK